MIVTVPYAATSMETKSENMMIFFVETGGDDLLGMMKHQIRQPDLQQRELQQQHREDLNRREECLKRQEEEVHMREGATSEA